MYDFLRLKLFRSYEDVRLEFVPGLNVITARAESVLRNNIGKTNIFRGLRLLTDNRPLGGRFFSDFAGDRGTTEIELGMDGRTITLMKDVVVKDGKKTVKRSGYSIDGRECKEDYGALKGGVPDTIKSLLNLSDLNVQDQLDGPFLICSTPGEVAREFNKVTRLENADRIVSSFTTRINTAAQETKILEKQLEERRKEMEEYSDLPDIERVVQKAERIQKEMETCEENRARVEEAVDELARIEEDASDCRETVEAGCLVEECMRLLDGLDEKERNISSVQGQVDRLHAIDARLVQYGKESDAFPFVEKAMGLRDSIGKRTREIDRVSRLLHQLEDVEIEMAASERDKEESMREYVSVLKELKRCPTCFVEIDDDTLDRIVEEMQG